MKVLVFAPRLELGGTQANAIELAAALRDRHDFEVIFHAPPGPMDDMLRAKGLEFRPAPDARLHPSLARIRVLRNIVRREKPDLVHAWNWWQGIEAYCGVHLPMHVPLIISDMMMTLTRLLPRQVPTTFGVPALQQQAIQEGWSRAMLLPPPVDLAANAPDLLNRAKCRAAFGIVDHEIALVTVSRLSHTMKAASLARTIESVRQLGRQLPIRLLIVGDGSARAELQHRATRANRELHRTAVTLGGAMSDPRAAYTAADIVIGMGGSALRGMAFGKPVIVTGQHGFARIFQPETADWFTANGIYGIDSQTDNAALEGAIRRLVTNATLRRSLGRFGREYVRQHHDLSMLSNRFATICQSTRLQPHPPSLQDAARSAVIYLRDRRLQTGSRDCIARKQTPR